jgi:hypothetical protein
VEQLGAGSGTEGVQALPRRRSSSSGLTAGGYAVLPSSVTNIGRLGLLRAGSKR